MKIADATLNAIDEITSGWLASAQPKTSVTAAAAIRTSDESRSPVIDMARL